MNITKIFVFVYLILLGATPLLYAQNETIIVGTKETAPFMMKTEEGSWSGISIALWNQIATELELTSEIRDLGDLDHLIEAVETESVDIAVGALSITKAREIKFDFTHPFHVTGLSIAVPAKQSGQSWLTVIKGFFSPEFMEVVLVWSIVLSVFGLLIWLFERKRNPDQFGGSLIKGIGAGFWWSAVTMTTVGYGDKAPVTLGGRILGLVWMFAGLIVISSFTAAITTSLTLNKLEPTIKSPQDLVHVRVGTVSSSTSENYLKEHRLSYRGYETIEEGMNALASGEIEAMVYDAPILKYMAKYEYNGQLKVLPYTFKKQYYGFALPHNSPYRETINQALLDKISEPGWQDVLYQYLGE